MIIYEVNLTVDPEIFSDYYTWLIDHIQKMLKFSGFTRAEVATEKKSVDEAKHLTVRYFVSSENHLEDYFQNHANYMRQATIDRFGDKVSATRRVFHSHSMIHEDVSE